MASIPITHRRAIDPALIGVPYIMQIFYNLIQSKWWPVRWSARHARRGAGRVGGAHRWPPIYILPGHTDKTYGISDGREGMSEPAHTVVVVEVQV